MICDFHNDLAYSKSAGQIKKDTAIIKSAISNCIGVYKTPIELDRRGIDYIAVLDSGAILTIDAKLRRKGGICKDGEPLLALGTWSVCPNKETNDMGKAGWTCDRSTSVDFILYTYEESNKYYLIPFQPLRMAFQRNYRLWAEKWRPRRQSNGDYESEAIFVPACIVLDAVKAVMEGKMTEDME